MKKTLLISILILLAFSLKATQYYVNASTGSNSNTGLVGSPWLSFAYACTQIPAGSHTLNVASGTYPEPGTWQLATGVNIVGAGSATTIIQCTYAFATSSTVDRGCMRLSSTARNTNGNQTISGLTFDGSVGGVPTASRAIVVYNRGNVHITDCTVKNFFAGGILFGHTDMYTSSLSLVFAENNEVGNCTIDNCGDTQGTYDGYGLIFITCQKDMLIHDNILTNNKRVGSHNSYIVNAGSRRFRGLKFYNNQCTLPDYNYSGWAFMLEFWGNDGGLEIYNNTFVGSDMVIDIGGPGLTNNTGGYPYTWSIHDNIFKGNTTAEYTGYSRLPILIESYYVDNVYIYNNQFNDAYQGIALTSFNSSNIFIYDNTFYRVLYPFGGRFDSQGQSTFPGSLGTSNVNFYRNKMYPAISIGRGIDGCIKFNTSTGWDVDGLNIYNNTIVTNNIVDAKGINIVVGSGTTVSNVNIKNNILCYMKNTGPFVITNNGTISGLHIENNFSYNLANANALISYTGTSATNYTTTNNLPTANNNQASPLFVNESTQDYHLQSGSPCVNSGQVVAVSGSNLSYLGAAPDRGYIEYDAGGGIALGTVTLNTSPDVDANSFYITATVTDAGAGGGIVSERGICWNTSTTPTTSNSKLINGSGLGLYHNIVESLLSNVTYYIRAYCINQTGTAYSNQVTITTTLINPVVASTVVINGLVSSSSRSISLNSSVSSDGGGTISERGICWHTSASPTTSNNKQANGSGLGVFFNEVTDLSPNTTYYLRAYAINEAGTSYSNQMEIRTSDLSDVYQNGQPVYENGKIVKN